VPGLAHGKNVLEMRDEAPAASITRMRCPRSRPTAPAPRARSLVAREVATVREDPLDHDYKELTIPPVDGKPASR
jgi:hypothetical protein